jgi:hypothetical protein
LTVLSPLGRPPDVVESELAPRLDALAGKTVYLVDCGFVLSGAVLEQVQQWLAAHQPAVTTRVVRWSGEDGGEAADEVAARGDAAILGVGI